MQDHHAPVLLNEVIEQMAIKPEGIYVDGTFGRGGHSREILKHLSAAGRLIAFDKDPKAYAAGQQLAQKDPRFSIYHGSFIQIERVISELGYREKVAGILLDLGMSSPQLDDPVRGFSFMRAGPLDMRMDTTRGQTAAEWLNSADAEDIAQVLKEYGEERFGKRIAQAIVTQRQQQPLQTTQELVAVIEKAIPFKERHKHPATRSFQGIRIYINRELEDLKTVLPQCLEVLAVGGRLLVISFHSLEDRMVKQFIHLHSTSQLPPDLPVKEAELHYRFRKKGSAIRASDSEINQNPRARSAVLRVAEKLL